MATSKNDERQPLISGSRALCTDVSPTTSTDDVNRPDDEGGSTTRRYTFNLLVGYLLLALVQLSGVLFQLDLTPYIYYRISEQLYGPDFSSPTKHPCVHNASSSEQQKADDIQEETSKMMMHLNLSIHLPSLLTIGLVGAYSDYLGRRFLFLIALIGYLFRSGVTTVVAYWELNLNWLYLGYLLNACCGGTWTMLLAVSCYTADNTPPSGTRTLCLAVAGAAAVFVGVAGSFGGGYFIQYTNFFYPFLAVSGLFVISIAIAFVFLNETTSVTDPSGWPTPLQAAKGTFGFYFYKSATAEESDAVPSSPSQGRIAEERSATVGSSALTRDLHRGLGHAKVPASHGTGVMTETTSNEDTSPLIASVSASASTGAIVDRRPEFILGIFAFFFAVLPALSLGSIEMLYVMNKPFCWETKTFGIYTSIREVAQHTTCLVMVKALAKRVNEGWLSVLGFMSAGAGFFVMALADRNWMMYLAPGVSVFAPLSIIVIRSLMSQRAPSGKQGSLFASIAFLETACNAFGSFVFNFVYSKTVSTTRGATFWLTVAFIALGTVIMGGYMAAIRRSDRRKQRITLAIQEAEVETQRDAMT